MFKNIHSQGNLQSAAPSDTGARGAAIHVLFTASESADGGRTNQGRNIEYKFLVVTYKEQLIVLRCFQ